MRRITDVQEYREIQMNILDRIHKYCEENNLMYSLSSGTLLGAIRHKGYIPWDDDIDIYMPRDSYNRFIKNFGVQDGHYQLIDHNNRNPYHQTFAKVIDTNTEGYEQGSPIPDLGIWVDVFPIDGMPNNKFLRALLMPFKRFFSMIIQSGIKGNRITLKYLFCRYFPIPFSWRYGLFDFIITRWPKSELICNLSSGGPLKDRSFPKDCFSSMIDINFENRKYKAMKGWDQYLKATYGEYMKLPPEEQRIHHDFIAYIKD